jgi:hypothetical protein
LPTCTWFYFCPHPKEIESFSNSLFSCLAGADSSGVVQL